MELDAIIRKLRGERAKLDQLIETVEQLQLQRAAAAIPKVKKRRGRKSMNAEQRREVAERMRRYWAGWRAVRHEAPDATGSVRV